MNEKLDAVKAQLEEISKLPLSEQPAALTKLYEELDSELNSANSDER